MSNKILHVLYLPRWYPNRNDPMPGLFIRRHAEAASAHCRISVVYVHADEHQKTAYELVKTSEINLFTAVVYYRGSKGNKAIGLWRFLRANMIGINAVKKEFGRPDLTHVHVLTRLAFVAWWLKFRYGVPYLITEHWSRYIATRNEFRGAARKWLTRFLVGKAALVTTVTHNLADAMKQHGLNHPHYRILPNVVDTSLFVPVPDKLNSPKRIMHVSCFEDRSKNISGLLRALKTLSARRNDFECIMVGDGMDFESIRLLSEALGLQNMVKFTGLLEGAQLASTLSSGDFLVLFSNYENLPVVIPEALACGLPVIATNVGGIAEQIHAGNGRLVEARDEDALAASIDWMLDNLAQFNPDDLRLPIVAKNSPQAVGNLLYNWYLWILGRHNIRASFPDQT
ncbi:MAG TPA: glycosyltransferase [Bacteroidales bacterium]|nr:glycosyltransferase [Bacteroidales bacterium]